MGVGLGSQGFKGLRRGLKAYVRVEEIRSWCFCAVSGP